MYVNGAGNVFATDPTANSQYGTTVTGTGSSVLGKDDFLKLLVTQLENQDPLNPKSNEEYVAQLAQFSSLEQMQNMNASLAANSQISQSVNNALTASLIGKEVQAVGNETLVSGTGDITLPIGVAANANAVIKIVDASGKTVRTLNADNLKAGQNDVKWDGKNDQGERVAEGPYTYTVEAKDPTGNAVQAQGSFTGIVTGVKFVNGSPVLIVGAHDVPIGSVIAVRQPGSH